LPDASQITETTATPGDWRMPLQGRIDGKVQGTGSSNVSLQIVPAETQTADLLQCQDISGNPLFGIRLDGHIVSANVEAQAPTKDVEMRLKLFKPNGDLWGHISVQWKPSEVVPSFERC
jgi:hypothetical protein